MAGNAIRDSHAGSFATGRRRGLTGEELREIEAHRARERPTSWQNLALRYGRCEADLRDLYEAGR